jgi:hypothetical protein
MSLITPKRTTASHNFPSRIGPTIVSLIDNLFIDKRRKGMHTHTHTHT